MPATLMMEPEPVTDEVDMHAKPFLDRREEALRHKDTYGAIQKKVKRLQATWADRRLIEEARTR